MFIGFLVNMERSDKSFLLLEAQDLRLCLTSTATALSIAYICAIHFLGERHKKHAFSLPTKTNDTQNHAYFFRAEEYAAVLLGSIAM
jgi:hypothetical protein